MAIISYNIPMMLHSLNDRIHRTWNPMQLALLQEICFCLVLVLLTPVYTVNLNMDVLVQTLETNRATYSTLHDLQAVAKTLEEIRLPSEILTFRTFVIIMVFLFTISSTLNSKREESNTNIGSSNVILIGIASWIVVCFYICLPIKFVLLSRLDGVTSLLTHPVLSLLSLVIFGVSLPFSIVAKSPFTFQHQNHLVDINQRLMEVINGRITIADSTRLESLYTVSYNWRVLLPLVVFLSSCYVVIVHSDCAGQECERCCDSEDVIQPGNVKRMSKHFEVKNDVRATKSKMKSMHFAEEEIIRPVTCSLVTHAKPRSPITLAKVRPMNVTKPIQHQDNTFVGKDVTESLNEKGFKNVKSERNRRKGSQWRPTMSASSSQTKILTTKDTEQQFNGRLSTRRNVVTKDTSVQYDVTIFDDTSKQHDVGVSKDITIQCDSVSTSCTSTQYDVVVTNEKPTQCAVVTKETLTQCDFVVTKETPTQCDVVITKETPTQCDVVVTKETPTQCDVAVTVDTQIQCEILSMERYVKLQQNALALYKKTVQQREWRPTTSPKKVHISSSVTKFNKSVQVNFKQQHHRDEGNAPVVHPNGHSTVNSSNAGERGMNVGENGSLSDAITNFYTKADSDVRLSDNETQTDLFGYVLDRIIQERETSNVYSKSDLERTVHSVLSLPEKVKQYTETIRFKAMKSQHGVWYVSLRGDIFLTVSQDILRNVKLNAERKTAATEISSDILRAMKMYVDNYNKLSDCFEEDDESDDESFINGFRL